MRKITLTVTCSCGFWVQRTFCTNEHGYFEIPAAYCPNCFNVLVWSAADHPVDVDKIQEIHYLEQMLTATAKDDTKRMDAIMSRLQELRTCSQTRN